MSVRKRKNPAAYLSDDLIVEILARLPERPLRRYKCVSRSWRDLISGPVHRRRLAHPDTVSGFFYHAHADGSWAPVTDLKFTALYPPVEGGASPPPLLDHEFSFLPSRYTRTDVELLDSSNGLLLLRYCDASDELAPALYVVYNPSTQDCVELPLPPRRPLPLLLSDVLEDLDVISGGGGDDDDDDDDDDADIIDDHLLQLEQGSWIQRLPRPAALAFDPTVSSHFHVFELEEESKSEFHGCGGRHGVVMVRIYSSETMRWVVRRSGWNYHVSYSGEHAYLNGFLHLGTTDTENGIIAAVDTEGQTWTATRVCPEPPAKLDAPGVIGQSQRRVLYADAGSGYARELSVYALEDCGGGAGRWVLKHRARSLDPSGKVWFGKQHRLVAIHPDCNVVFLFDSRRRSLIAYDMDRGTTRDVHTFPVGSGKHPYFFPYIPLYLQQ